MGSGNPGKGKQIAETRCAACHGADGNSTAPQYPKLAGQNPAYLYAQLWAFNVGARNSEIMSGIAGGMSHTEAADVASYYARRTIRPDPVTDTALAGIGRRIFFDGGGPAGLPPCAICHRPGGRPGMPMMRGGMPMMGRGMTGPGAVSSVPGVSGQHAVYVLEQLNRFADGRRPGTVMPRIAAALNETHRKAVAEFVSGLR